jgi:DNA-binding SARP family transcriptional activator
MTIEVKVLGSLQASACGTSVVPSAPKQRQILALLALNPGRTVPAHILVEEIWREHEPKDPVANVQTYILQLRRKLKAVLAPRDAGSSKDILTTAPGGYILNTPRDNVDAGRYECLVSAGHRAIYRGDHTTAARTLADALDVWRGKALVDVAIGPHLQIERTRLEESRLCTLDLRIDADLRLGRHRLLLDELAALCARHPWFENFHAQYMFALYRSGLRWRALEVYRRLHNTVGKHLGVDPSRHLQQLHLAMLANDPAVDDPSFVMTDWMSRSSA